MYNIVNAPLPTNLKPTKGQSKYPFNQLEVGQSFFVPNREANLPEFAVEEAALLRTLKTHVSRWNTKITPDKKFHVAVSQSDDRWLQVWRSV